MSTTKDFPVGGRDETKVSIKLSKGLKEIVDRGMEKKGYKNLSDYIRDAIIQMEVGESKSKEKMGLVIDTFERYRKAMGTMLHRREKVEGRMVLEGMGDLAHDASQGEVEFIFLVLELFRSLQIYISRKTGSKDHVSGRIDDEVFGIALAKYLGVEDIIPALVPDEEVRAQKLEQVIDPKVTILQQQSILNSYIRAHINPDDVMMNRLRSLGKRRK